MFWCFGTNWAPECTRHIRTPQNTRTTRWIMAYRALECRGRGECESSHSATQPQEQTAALCTLVSAESSTLEGACPPASLEAPPCGSSSFLNFFLPQTATLVTSVCDFLLAPVLVSHLGALVGARSGMQKSASAIVSPHCARGTAFDPCSPPS